MRELLTILLSGMATTCSWPRMGAPRLAALKRGNIDLLISDIRMPEMNGVDVLREAKPLDRVIAGIVMTAFASARIRPWRPCGWVRATT